MHLYVSSVYQHQQPSRSRYVCRLVRVWCTCVKNVLVMDLCEEEVTYCP